ncbi:MAG: outer membrane protein transport protein [Magnetococcus sp. WYHC-3]
MQQQMRISTLALAAITGLAAAPALATNAMNLEGYGARAHAMGGAGMAYDTGNSGVMNNPATLSMMDAEARLGLGIRMLGPDVSLAMPTMGLSTDSDGTAYFMPSLSYMRRSGDLTYGIGVFAQGGMGTEYGTNNPMFSVGQSMGGTFISSTGMAGSTASAIGAGEQRSELSVGRAIIPLSYRVNPRFNIAASIDLVWMGMDMQMDMSGAQIADMMPTTMNPAATNAMGTMSPSAGMAGAMGTMTDLYFGRFDFSDNSDFTGEAFGMGAGFKVGATYTISPMVTVGASYHSKTMVEDLSTDGASITFNGLGNWDQNAATADTVAGMTLTGTMDVVDFEWPQKFTVGTAFHPSETLMLVADVSWVNWANTMKNFKMKFTADGSAANTAMGMNGQTLDVSMKQEWDNQFIVSLGGEVKATDKLALRAGVSLANNPVPDEYANPLFPAIVENHITAGAGYSFNEHHHLGFAAAVGLDADTNSPWTGLQIDHGQFNWSLNYSYDF